MKVRLLPLSYGREALCLRLDGGDRTYRLGWTELGHAVRTPPGGLTGTRGVYAVTVHHQLDGNIGVSVDEDDLRIYTPEAFEALVVRFGELQDPPPREDAN